MKIHNEDVILKDSFICHRVYELDFIEKFDNMIGVLNHPLSRSENISKSLLLRYSQYVT